MLKVSFIKPEIDVFPTLVTSNVCRWVWTGCLSPLLLFITRRYRLPSCTVKSGLVSGQDFPLMVQRL